jgi:hypothetical protein
MKVNVIQSIPWTNCGYTTKLDGNKYWKYRKKRKLQFIKIEKCSEN